MMYRMKSDRKRQDGSRYRCQARTCYATRYGVLSRHCPVCPHLAIEKAENGRIGMKVQNLPSTRRSWIQRQSWQVIQRNAHSDHIGAIACREVVIIGLVVWLDIFERRRDMQVDHHVYDKSRRVGGNSISSTWPHSPQKSTHRDHYSNSNFNSAIGPMNMKTS